MFILSSTSIKKKKKKKKENCKSNVFKSIKFFGEMFNL